MNVDVRKIVKDVRHELTATHVALKTMTQLIAKEFPVGEKGRVINESIDRLKNIIIKLDQVK